jgi:hypothetical protein
MIKFIQTILNWIQNTFFVKDIMPTPAPTPQPIPTPPPTPVTPVIKTIKQIVTETAISQGIEPELCLAVAQCEGGLSNAKITRKNTNGSIDRGIYQWNNRVFPGVTDAQAFDPAQATILFCNAVKGGHLHGYWYLSQPNWSKLLSPAIKKKYNIT